MKKIPLVALLILTAVPVLAQQMKWSTTRSVRKELKRQAKRGNTFYSQFDWYAPRERGDLQSQYSNDMGKELLIYGVDFYYASGTWFSESYRKKCRENLVNIVKEAWRKNHAIPSFSWHLENPYANSECTEYMGCRYRYDPQTWPNYPEEHRYVIREILGKTGSSCGYGGYKRADNKDGFRTPREWFEAQCKEVAEIINEFCSDSGKPIPIIFRLWHECEDSWTWWGPGTCSDEDYKKFFVLTERLIKKHTPRARILWGYCTDRYWANEEDYLKRYPGDEHVDVIGYDDYSIRNDDTAGNPPLERARFITKLAKKHNKIAAIFETSNRDEKTSGIFFREKVSAILKDDQTGIALFQMWSSGRYFSEAEKKDRAWMLLQPYILAADKK